MNHWRDWNGKFRVCKFAGGSFADVARVMETRSASSALLAMGNERITVSTLPILKGDQP